MTVSVSAQERPHPDDLELDDLHPDAKASLAERGAAFAAVLTAPGMQPFVVWSKRPLAEAAADALHDALRCLRAAPTNGATPVTEPAAADTDGQAPSRPSYHQKGNL